MLIEHGLVGQDGETHQGLLDLSFFNIVPNLTIMAPKDFSEFRKMIRFATSLNSPCVIRYPRGGEDSNVKFGVSENIRYGEAEILNHGKDITIIAIGKMVARAYEVAKDLENRGIYADVINARFLKPLDENKIKNSIEKTKNVVTIEDNIIEGGLATKVKELIVDDKLRNVNFKCFGYPDEFIKHGKVDELELKYRLDKHSIENKIMQDLGRI